jgi:hypothetical protein
MLGATANWIIALCAGGAMVAFGSWGRFDDPSYDSDADFFTRYKPRFSTYRGRYAHARYGYISTFLAIYLIFSFVPEIFYALLSVEADVKEKTAIQSPTVLPVVIALALVTFQRSPISKEVERRIRSFFHALAQIPEGIRRTVALLRNSDFAFDPNAVSLQTTKLGLTNPDDSKPAADIFPTLLQTDQIANLWYGIGCLLFALADEKRGEIDLDPLFFDSYQDEFNVIASKHAEAIKPVRQHLNAILKNPGLCRPGIVNDHESLLYSELRTLRDRLYTFLACAVRSSVKTEIESASILRMLGFGTHLPPHVKGDMLSVVGPIVALSFIGVMLLSVLTGFSTQLFSDHVLAPLGNPWAEVFPVPRELFKIYTWSWTTALFYAASVVTAMALREARISQRRWFDINESYRHRPLLSYAMPAIAGTVSGCVTLTIIAFANGPGFHFDPWTQRSAGGVLPFASVVPAVHSGRADRAMAQRCGSAE